MLLHHYMGDIDDTVGAWGFARGGMGAITQALGGLVRRRAAARSAPRRRSSEILVRGGRAAASRSTDGEEIHAPRGHLQPRRASAPFSRPWTPKHLPPEFVEQVRSFKIRGSSGKLNIALDGLPHFPAIPQGSP